MVAEPQFLHTCAPMTRTTHNSAALNQNPQIFHTYQPPTPYASYLPYPPSMHFQDPQVHHPSYRQSWNHDPSCNQPGNQAILQDWARLSEDDARIGASLHQPQQHMEARCDGDHEFLKPLKSVLELVRSQNSQSLHPLNNQPVMQEPSYPHLYSSAMVTDPSTITFNHHPVQSPHLYHAISSSDLLSSSMPLANLNIPQPNPSMPSHAYQYSNQPPNLFQQPHVHSSPVMNNHIAIPDAYFHLENNQLYQNSYITHSLQNNPCPNHNFQNHIPQPNHFTHHNQPNIDSPTPNLAHQSLYQPIPNQLPSILEHLVQIMKVNNEEFDKETRNFEAKQEEIRVQFQQQMKDLGEEVRVGCEELQKSLRDTSYKLEVESQDPEPNEKIIENEGLQVKTLATPNFSLKDKYKGFVFSPTTVTRTAEREWIGKEAKNASFRAQSSSCGVQITTPTLVSLLLYGFEVDSDKEKGWVPPISSIISNATGKGEHSPTDFSTLSSTDGAKEDEQICEKVQVYQRFGSSMNFILEAKYEQDDDIIGIPREFNSYVGIQVNYNVQIEKTQKRRGKAEKLKKDFKEKYKEENTHSIFWVQHHQQQSYNILRAIARESAYRLRAATVELDSPPLLSWIRSHLHIPCGQGISKGRALSRVNLVGDRSTADDGSERRNVNMTLKRNQLKKNRWGQVWADVCSSK